MLRSYPLQRPCWDKFPRISPCSSLLCWPSVVSGKWSGPGQHEGEGGGVCFDSSPNGNTVLSHKHDAAVAPWNKDGCFRLFLGLLDVVHHRAVVPSHNTSLSQSQFALDVFFFFFILSDMESQSTVSVTSFHQYSSIYPITQHNQDSQNVSWRAAGLSLTID